MGFSNVRFTDSCSMKLSNGRSVSTINYVDGDVVEYLTCNVDAADESNCEGAVPETRLGVVAPNRKEIYPLCVREDTFVHCSDIKDYFTAQSCINSDKELVLYYDEDSPPVIISDELTLTTGSIYDVVHEASYSQRIVEDRVSNPHGEHAEDVWIIKFGHLRKLIDQDGILRIANENKTSKNYNVLGSVLHNKRLILPLGDSH